MFLDQSFNKVVFILYIFSTDCITNTSLIITSVLRTVSKEEGQNDVFGKVSHKMTPIACKLRIVHNFFFHISVVETSRNKYM